MTPFEYLSVLFSIILGLALTHLLGSVAGLMHARGRVVAYGPPLIWVGLIFFIIVQHWWAEFSLRGVREWTFAGYVAVLSTPITLYLLSALALPERAETGTIDLRTWYYENRRWFYALVFVLPLCAFAEQLVINGRIELRPAEIGFLSFFEAVSAVAFFTKRPRVHEVLTVVVAVAIAAFIASLYGRLAG